jgi:ribosomal protein S18 acetylase RimI-like enzyme
MTGVRPPLRALVLNEARAYAVFAGGGVTDHGFAVSVVCERLPESRKQGVARALMLRAIEESRAARLSALCLQTRAESFQERFYRELGFEVVARRNRAVRGAV